MIISDALRRYLSTALGAHLFPQHCVIGGRPMYYHAMSVDIREEQPRVTLTRAVTLGLFALAAKKKVAYVTLQDWQTGATITVKVSGKDVQKAYEFKNMLHLEQVLALKGFQ